MLPIGDNLVGIINKTVGKLRNMNQAVLVNTNVHKSAKIGDIGNNTRKTHALTKIFDLVYIFVKAEYFERGAWIALSTIRPSARSR